MLKILVTGGSGFIGSAVIRMMIDRGHAVVNLDCLTYAANPANLASVEGSDRYAFEKVDIRDSDAVARVFAEHRPDGVMHLAAESHVDRSIEAPDAFIQTNVNGTFSMLDNALRYWKSLTGSQKDYFRFIHVSTDEVYGDLDVDDPAFGEKTPYNPSSPYSASKAASDHLARAWNRTFGLPVIVTNCSNNYGPYQFPEKLIPVVINKILRREPIPVYGSGENIRDWLYVDDHADALLTVMKNGSVGETYNIGGNSEATNIALVKSICAIMDDLDPGQEPHSGLISFVQDRPGHDRRYAIDARKIESELGWTPSRNLHDGLRETVAWYLHHRDVWEPLLADGEDRRRGLPGQGKG